MINHRSYKRLIAGSLAMLMTWMSAERSHGHAGARGNDVVRDGVRNTERKVIRKPCSHFWSGRKFD